MNLIVVFILAFSQSLWKACNGNNLRSLAPEKTIFNDVLYDGQVAVYQAVSLAENSTYEVRVSYPAVVPTEFAIRVIPPHKDQAYKSRKILNIEKTVFATTNITEGYVIEITAHRIGFPWNPERLSDPVVFNIVLETLYGGLSVGSWKIVGYAFLTLVITLRFIVPLVHGYIVSVIIKNEHTN